MASTRCPSLAVFGPSLSFLLLVTLCHAVDKEKWQNMLRTNATTVPVEDYQALEPEHQKVLDHVEESVNILRERIGKLYSKNSALLHRMMKLDDYIKRGGDMETRYLVEILGYPWDQKVIPPDTFLEHLANSLGISNFTQSQVKGLRILAGVKYFDARIVVEFSSAKIKKLWLKAYKNKLYEISWGDPEKVFGTKETFKTFQHKRVYLQDFLPTLCEMHPIGAVPFSINEYIPPFRKKLLSYAKLLAKHYQYRFVWVSEGDILMRKANKDQGIYIRTQKDFRALDWRLENTDFFWKTINECNAKRREFFRQTTMRILPWMTRNVNRMSDEEVWRTTHNLLLYKRKFDVHLNQLLEEANNEPKTTQDTFDVTYKYRFRTFKIKMNATTCRNKVPPSAPGDAFV